MTSEEARGSLLRRLGGAHHLWRLAVRDLTTEQVNHVERPGVLPLAFSLLHCVHGEDRNVSSLLARGPLLWETHGPGMLAAGEIPARGAPMAVAERIRLADLEAWRRYQEAVHSRTEQLVRDAPLARFDEQAFAEPRPAHVEGSFLALIATGPVSVLDCLEAYVYQHRLRHLGEIEHGRALVGLGGVS